MRRVFFILMLAWISLLPVSAVINPNLSFAHNESLQNCYMACQCSHQGIIEGDLSLLKESYAYFSSCISIPLRVAVNDSSMLLPVESRFRYDGEYIETLFENVDIGSIERGGEINRMCHTLSGALQANGMVVYTIPNAEQISRLCVWVEPMVDAKISMDILDAEIGKTVQSDLVGAVCVLECLPGNKELTILIQIQGTESASFILITD